MTAAHRKELLRIRRALVTEYHKLSDVLCTDELGADEEKAARAAFARVDEAICAINQPFGIKP